MKDKIEKLFLKTASGIKPGLSITKNLLKNLDNPQNNYLTIHVAGTNGKGSVASYIEKILNLSGFNTGLYTSPHLYDFRERIKVNGKMVDEKSLLSLLDEVQEADTGDREATFFEFTTAIAFKYFSDKKIDIGVIETGMGGKFDSTNVISPILSIITNVSIDHTEFLGSDLKSIAAEKAGIIKYSTPVITAENKQEALDIITDSAKNNASKLFCIDKDFKILTKSQGFVCETPFKNRFELKPKLKGWHQIINSATACLAVDILNNSYKKKFNIKKEVITKGIKETSWRGRLEKISDNPEIIVDCAHNPDAAKTLYNYLKSKNKSITLIFGSLADKDYKETLSILEPVCEKIIFTNPDSKRALDPFKLKNLVKTDSLIIEKPIDAINYAKKNSHGDSLICIAGSIYLSGLIIEAFDGGKI